MSPDKVKPTFIRDDFVYKEKGVTVVRPVDVPESHKIIVTVRDVESGDRLIGATYCSKTFEAGMDAEQVYNAINKYMMKEFAGLHRMA